MTANGPELTYEGRIAFDYADTTVLERPYLPDVETPLSRRYLALMQRWIPFAMPYFQDWPVRPNCGHFFGGLHFYGSETINPLLVLVAAISSPEYDRAIIGLSRDELIAVAIKAFRYACFTHDTGPADCLREYHHLPGLRRRDDHPWQGTKWGERGKGFFPESQCGRNISSLVMAAIILRPWLDEETWMMLARICADYLERFGEMPPRSGVYFDTQAEENAWTALGLTATRLFLGRHASAPNWAESAKRWMFCAAAAPEDMRDYRVYAQDKSVRDLCGRLFTLLPDFMAENHGMVHPSYTGSPIALMGSTVNLCRLFGEQEPPHWAWHRQEIYDNLKRLSDRNGMFHPVQGMDWPYVSPCALPVVHSFARLYLRDADAAYYEEAALELAEAILKGNKGRVYHPDVVENCHSIQDPMILNEVQVSGLACPYLAHRLCSGEPIPEATTPAFEARYAGVKTYAHSGFVFHRHPRGQTSFSWRNEIMALPLTREGLLTIAPSSGSVLGNVRVAEFAKSQRVELLDVNDQRTGFAAVMRVALHDDSIRQDVLLASLPDGRLVCREAFRAMKGCTVERVEQGHLEVMNETFPEMGTNCVGQRRLFSPAGEQTFPSLVRPTPDDDTWAEYGETAWLNLDDRMGIVIASAEHRSVYHNRHSFTPFHAVTDDLFLNLQERAQPYAGNQVIADIAYMLCPEQGHDETPAQRLLLAQATAGTWGILAGTTLVVGNLDAESGNHAFRFPRPQAIPVFAGLTRIDGDEVIYEAELLRGRGQFLEPLALVESSEPVTIVALPSGQLYATNSGPRKALLSIRGHLVDKEVSIGPGETTLLASQAR